MGKEKKNKWASIMDICKKSRRPKFEAYHTRLLQLSKQKNVMSCFTSGKIFLIKNLVKYTSNTNFIFFLLKVFY